MPRRINVYGLRRIAQVGSSDTFYYLADGLGSTIALADESGDVDTTWDYDVFGAVRGTSGGQPNGFTFAGERVDGSTGLQSSTVLSSIPSSSL